MSAHLHGSSHNLQESRQGCVTPVELAPEATRGRRVQVQRLAVLSLSSVFKDILPGYRVRDLTDAEEGVQVTKAVQKLRDYERTLAKAFQSYVKLLRSMLSSKASSLNHKRCVMMPASCCTCCKCGLGVLA